MKMKFIMKEMKTVVLLIMLVAISISSCTKEDNPDDKEMTCEVESLTKTVVGNWKDIKDGMEVSFSTDKKYVDSKMVLHGCTEGTWSAINNDTKLELICGTTFFNDVAVSSFSCDTMNIKAYGIKRVFVRQ